MSRFNPNEPSSEQILRNDSNVLQRAKVNKTLMRNIGKKAANTNEATSIFTGRTRSRGGRNQ